MRYRTDTDFRKALEERLRQRAERDGEPISRLRKRVVFERCMARLQKDKEAPWILKGGFALELRLGNRARMTTDLDLTVSLGFFDAESGSLSQLAARLRDDLKSQNEDKFFFLLAEGREEQLPTTGVKSFRFAVEARLDGRTFEKITVDVGIGDPLIPPLEEIEASDLLAFAEIPSPRIRVTSEAQHFAEKLHALTRPFDDRINTRVKDLADVMLLMDRGLPDLPFMKQCVQEIFSARATHVIPDRIGPLPVTWTSSYSAMATNLQLHQTTVDDATTRLNKYWGQFSGK